MVESILFFVYSMGSVLCFMSNTSLFLGLCMILCSILISVSVSLMKNWFGMIFFLVFVSGLLVLVFYVMTMDYNVVFSLSGSSVFVLFPLLLSLVFVSFSKKSNFVLSNQSTNFVKNYEGTFLVFLGVIILLVLWLIVKLVFVNRGKLRVVY